MKYEWYPHMDYEEVDVIEEESEEEFIERRRLEFYDEWFQYIKEYDDEE